jgi:hypothetical protein
MDKQSPEEWLDTFVHVEFKRFVDADHSGNERPDGEARSGYLIYNAHRQDFGFGSFRSSDDYTIDADVLDFVKQRHPDFVPYIASTDGVYIDGTWRVVKDGHGMEH